MVWHHIWAYSRNLSLGFLLIRLNCYYGISELNLYFLINEWANQSSASFWKFQSFVNPQGLLLWEFGEMFRSTTCHYPHTLLWLHHKSWDGCKDSLFRHFFRSQGTRSREVLFGWIQRSLKSTLTRESIAFISLNFLDSSDGQPFFLVGEGEGWAGKGGNRVLEKLISFDTLTKQDVVCSKQLIKYKHKAYT